MSPMIAMNRLGTNGKSTITVLNKFLRVTRKVSSASLTVNSYIFYHKNLWEKLKRRSHIYNSSGKGPGLNSCTKGNGAPLM